MSKGKYAYEQACYFDEDVDESVFEDGCKYKQLYTELKARRDAKKRPPSFNEAVHSALSQYDEKYKTDTNSDTFTIRRRDKLNTRHDKIRTAIAILDELEKDFHHPSETKTSEEYNNTVTGAAEKMKHTIHNMGLDTSNTDIKDMVDRISGLKSGTAIFKFLYDSTF